ncbi:hypothetical protein [Sphingosinicella sp.]|uniref:hypothetical protein n=1 Tax=Sphingosinicella sp. TaxID=1917971 RepID=UPI004037E0DE
MSTIPNRASPRAVAEPEGEERNGSSFLFDNARRLAETARENPGTALAVGAGVVAATAAATVALTRGRGETAGSKGRKRKG